MRIGPATSLLPALLLALAAAPAAHADKLTLGSDLSADATVVEAHGQDTAIWPVTVKGQSAALPEDGQILSVTMKGTALKERGAANPATLIHFQSLVPTGSGNSVQVLLSSQGFDMPIDQPNALTTFTPENLCVKKGGYLGFNDIGGFQYGGSLGAPLDPSHYLNGVPMQIVGAVANSVNARYSAGDKTNNGDTLNPNAGNDQGRPNGSVNRGQELLMRYVLATGDDRSQSCGGPARHPDGSLVEPKVRQLRVAGKGTQRPYVTKDRRFNVGVYCESPDDSCVGTGQLLIAGKPRQTVPVSISNQTSGRVGFRLSKKDFKKLDKAKKLPVSLVLTSQFGTVTTPLELHR